ncbi:hypothetical protein SAMN04488244_1566 [Vibrio hangzhouensis]|uniref:Uncharacterized protein n=1 Tax=Vibrio hangzhouensis TaxID=462991 RepID=A0A1H6CQK6_9VIBR|nr:hypothetical protein SAMN04488244_1566 [Vibrio hangzhouensis]
MSEVPPNILEILIFMNPQGLLSIRMEDAKSILSRVTVVCHFTYRKKPYCILPSGEFTMSSIVLIVSTKISVSSF